MATERWVVAVEGELGSDQRGLVIGQTIWLDKVPVMRFDDEGVSRLIGQLTDFQRGLHSPPQTITALYQGLPIQGTLSFEGVTVDSVGGRRSRWVIFEIRSAVDLEVPLMFAHWVRRV